jgi:hypothetical protein
MLALTCAAMVLRNSGNASRIAALGRMSKLNETVHPGRFGRVGDRKAGLLLQEGFSRYCPQPG